MSRHENRSTPKVVSGCLDTDDSFTGTVVGSPAWFTWLALASTFSYEAHPGSNFTVHREHRQRGTLYWTAYRRDRGLLRRIYLGKADQLTLLRLAEVALTFSRLPSPNE